VTLSNPSIDTLFEQVKSHIAAHRKDVVAPPARASRGYFPPSVYDRIDEAGVLADATTVQPFLTPSTVPIVGGLWQKIRLAAHNLVVFYVNRHAGAQMAFNREITGGLREVVETLDEDDGPAAALELAALRTEIEALQRRLARLEQALPGGKRAAE
jgi:hypothetical protein